MFRSVQGYSRSLSDLISVCFWSWSSSVLHRVTLWLSFYIREVGRDILQFPCQLKKHPQTHTHTHTPTHTRTRFPFPMKCKHMPLLPLAFIPVKLNWEGLTLSAKWRVVLSTDKCLLLSRNLTSLSSCVAWVMGRKLRRADDVWSCCLFWNWQKYGPVIGIRLLSSA